MSSKRIYEPLSSGKQQVCSRCFSVLGPIEKYGCDEKGTWFLSSCSVCGAKMRWYRNNDGSVLEKPSPEDAAADDENAFSFCMENGEIVMKTE